MNDYTKQQAATLELFEANNALRELTDNHGENILMQMLSERMEKAVLGVLAHAICTEINHNH
jgi:hypothetical protein